MARFSANLGFLWTDLTLPDAVRAAHRAGFDAVECHFPYTTDDRELRDALEETGLPMICLNTACGDREAGEFGLSAVPGEEARAREAIDRAISYAASVGARNVHVMAGRSAGRDGAHDAFVRNLRHAAERADTDGIGILVEPINRRDAPRYFLHTVEQAAAIVAETDHPAVRMMFDCYHVQISQGDLTRRLKAHLPAIGHIQMAGVPGRHEPDTGEVAYDRLIACVDGLGYDGHVGAEYVPRETTDAGLNWLAAFRSRG